MPKLKLNFITRQWNIILSLKFENFEKTKVAIVNLETKQEDEDV